MHAEVRQSNRDPAPAPSRPTVLIVDDAPENLAFLNQLLQPHCRVLAATTGKRALRIAAGNPRPDLILLDVVMPGLDGHATLEALASAPESRGIPVIFVTAMEGRDDELRGLEHGAVDYITKPIVPALLLARVRTQLELKRMRDALANQNVALEAEVSRRMAENDAIQQVTIRALAHLAETRDPETGNHIVRTQRYVRRLGEGLRRHPRFSASMTDHFIELLARSAPLHDIGKVGIPDAILLKPGSLTPDEWAVMRTHAAIGALAIEKAERDIGRPLEFLAVARQIARSHHERWDGKGYPDGLSGDEIPVAARLMALADVFDALITPRVYKGPMSPAAASELIVAGRGTHFDPDVVDAFLEAFDDFVAIAREHADAG